MFTTIVAIITGMGIGLSAHLVPQMIKKYKLNKSIKKNQQRKLLQIEVEQIVINQLKKLYEQEGREDDISKEKSNGFEDYKI